MDMLRRTALASLYPICTLTLFGFGLLFSLKMVIGGPQHIEKALSRSGVYNVVTQQVINDNKTSSSLPLEQAAVQQAVKQAFPPQLLEHTVNNVLNGVYAWLQGKSNNPTFYVNLSDAKNNLANYVAAYVQQRLDSLPTCTVANMPGDLSAIDPYTATCLPPGFDKTAAVQQAKQQALNNSDIIDNPVITANTLKNSDGKTVDEQLKDGPRLYRDLIWSVYGTGLLALSTGVGIVFLHRSRRRGARRLAIMAISVGLTSSLLAFFGEIVVKKAADSIATDNKTHLIESKLAGAIHLLVSDMRTWWLGYGLMLVALGAAIVIVIKYVWPPTPAERTEQRKEHQVFVRHGLEDDERDEAEQGERQTKKPAS